MFLWSFPKDQDDSTTPIIATKTNSPAIAGTKYISAVDCTGVAVGVGVGAAGSTANAVTACDGQ